MGGAAMNAHPTLAETPDAVAAEPRTAPTPSAGVIHASSGWGALVAGLQRGLHPELLLAWTVMLWLPAAVLALPSALWLYLHFGHSPQAALIAADSSGGPLAEAMRQASGEGALLAANGALALLLSVLLSPWLSGMIVAQIRTVYRLRMGGVLRAGLGEYPRMLRMLAWSLLLMAVAATVGVLVTKALGALAAGLMPDAAWPLPAHAGWLLPGLLVVLVHITVEAGRGWLGADLALNSVFEAWKRGLALLLRQPGETLIVYLGTSVVGGALALGFLYLRAVLGADGWTYWLLGLVCTQLVVASMAWGRSARLHGLADLATAHVIARQKQSASADPPPADAEQTGVA